MPHLLDSCEIGECREVIAVDSLQATHLLIELIIHARRSTLRTPPVSRSNSR